ncbi:histidine kinase/DNA gyrase B/HSP90-like ATPase [Hydrogenoanaerobacterium saccharovorans]|uniref:histidine kinase n=1 Tax=Hydrogenoanaerobacterium saccharovorans TaxID=474960 RepID=A0A1H8CGF7_9FIRM|nr:ATP-binding protein [Hydrogenoanaerobacterium saccharovorans]RPF43092.1 histidine kinase/DNA gyrase B/HSP90-like ATPase [Hydrogenoanaerobacterium saccharovorans]SEM94080.1 Histidine kinase-, DNA gyrase B-, and HSP90-like ATPase [Hydrogenoanaerobacterium saccharovorans]
MQELSLNILDIAQNSVKAGASEIHINVSEDKLRDKMTITIDDNGCGMTQEVVQRVIDPFYTTRTTRKVGLGVPFFKMAAEMTGGWFNIQSQVGEGTTVTGEFILSHIDRMPLGDMAETMCCLISCNPDINFVYTRKVDGEVFTVSTRDFTNVLGDVPLNVPQVMEFIKSYIRENTENLNGGTDTI